APDPHQGGDGDQAEGRGRPQQPRQQAAPRRRFQAALVPPPHATRLKMTLALVPPKPNELDMATSILRARALCGTRSIAVSNSGSSRLIVGGAIWSRMASTQKAASMAPAAPSRCPVIDLVEDMEAALAPSPRNRSTAPSSMPSAMVEVPCALT